MSDPMTTGSHDVRDDPAASGAPVEPGSPKDPGGPGDPVEPPQPEVVPSSTPDGPATIPSPSTPEGEPGPDPQTALGGTVGFAQTSEAEDSNPNASGPEALAGGMGISSERTGAELPTDSIEGTGSVGTSTTKTNGTLDPPTDAPAMDEAQVQATGQWREQQPPANESNTAEVPSHPNHPEHNPGHSH